MSKTFRIEQNTRMGTLSLIVFGLIIVALAALPLLGNTLAVQWAGEFLMLLALAVRRDDAKAEEQFRYLTDRYPSPSDLSREAYRTRATASGLFCWHR